MTTTTAISRLESRVLELIDEFAETDEEITRAAELSAVDVDSLDLVEIGQVVEDEFGIVVAPEDFQGAQTVGAMIDVLAHRLA